MKISSFISGLLVGAAGLFIWWPKTDPDSTSNTGKSMPLREELWERASASELLDDCRTASSERGKYQALSALGRISLRAFPEALSEATKDPGENKLSLEALGLLIHWAERDPKSALAWSWENLRNNGRWEEAAGQILETWIASGDLEVVTFLTEVKKNDDPLVAGAEEEDQALFLHDEQMRGITEWLYFYNEDVARAASANGIKMAMTFPPPTRFYDRFEIVEEVERSLGHWPIEKNDYSPRTFIKLKGRELGMEFPEDEPRAKASIETVNKSQPETRPTFSIYWDEARTDLSKSLANAAALDPKFRQEAYTVIFDSWSLANEGREPDYAALPADAREIWKDLSGLGPVNDDHRASVFPRK